MNIRSGNEVMRSPGDGKISKFQGQGIQHFFSTRREGEATEKESENTVWERGRGEGSETREKAFDGPFTDNQLT